MPYKQTLTDKAIADLVHKELKTRSLAVTSQYLDIHQPIVQNDTIKIERIDQESGNNLIVAYLPVKDEHFYFAIYIDQEKAEVVGFATEPRNTVCLIATSENLQWQEFSFPTRLKPSRFWNKGDLRKGNSTYEYSLIEYEPNPEPDEFEDKLKKLLALLIDDEENVKKLAAVTNAYISVTIDFHAGNQLLGGVTLDKSYLRQITQLGLSIEFGFTAWGNPFK